MPAPQQPCLSPSTLQLAYSYFSQQQYPECLALLQPLLQSTQVAPQVQVPLATTISTIALTMGNYNYALEVATRYQGAVGAVGGAAGLRYWGNLALLHLVMGMGREAVDCYQRMKGLVEGHQGVEFVLRMFLRVGSLGQLRGEPVIDSSPSLLEAYYMLNLALGKAYCGFSGAEPLLRCAYLSFTKHRKMNVAAVCLRQLLLLPLSPHQSAKLTNQLEKIMSLPGMSGYEAGDDEINGWCRYLAQDLIEFVGQWGDQAGQGEVHGAEWKTVLGYAMKKITQDGDVGGKEKELLRETIGQLLGENNPMIVREMKKNQLYTSAREEVRGVLAKMVEVGQKINRSTLAYATTGVLKWIIRRDQLLREQKSRNKSQFNHNDKQNKMPLSLARCVSSKSLKEQKQRSASPCFGQQLTRNANLQKKVIYKAIKFIEYGSFLSKRNFNSDGGEYRFVRVTQSVLKWAKNPQKIEQSCQVYPLKDIVSIHYGKCTPTLLKQSNHLLKEDLCFSLKLQKRTLDFYCKDTEQVTNWVYGFTYKLKQVNCKVRGYTLGRILWKRMFMLLRENFTQKIHKHERKFYYETAHAIILFGKNNMKIPQKIK